MDMTSATRIVAATLGVFALVAVQAASAAQKPKNQLLANATVKTVSATALTVTASGKDTSFTVDAKTRVVGKGVGTATAAKGGKATIADLLKAGDIVSVTYQDAGGTLHASRIDKRPAS